MLIIIFIIFEPKCSIECIKRKIMLLKRRLQNIKKEATKDLVLHIGQDIWGREKEDKL